MKIEEMNKHEKILLIAEEMYGVENVQEKERDNQKEVLIFGSMFFNPYDYDSEEDGTNKQITSYFHIYCKPEDMYEKWVARYMGIQNIQVAVERRFKSQALVDCAVSIIQERKHANQK